MNFFVMPNIKNECQSLKNIMAKFIIIVMAIFYTSNAYSEQITIVAIGADNTYGTGKSKKNTGGVQPSEAYPAQLEQMLRDKKIDVKVINEGVPGDNTPGILSRLDRAVPENTKIVILNVARGNDRHIGIKGEEDPYVDEIERKLKERGIKLIVLPKLKKVTQGVGLTFDEHHYNYEGHTVIAKYLLPKVLNLIGKK